MSDIWFLLATGPSQRREDIDLCRGKGTVVAINNAILMAPWADILYACDEHWWNHYHKMIPESATGQRLTASRYAHRWGAKQIPIKKTEKDGFGIGYVHTGGNSGFQMINWAINNKAKYVCLLGFDHQHTNGQKHCHPDHPKGMGNAGHHAKWVEAMEIAARDTRGTRVINCSRETALTCFERMELLEFIDGHCNT